MVSFLRGLLVPGGFGSRGAEGKILAARWARKSKVPYLGKSFMKVTSMRVFLSHLSYQYQLIQQKKVF